MAKNLPREVVRAIAFFTTVGLGACSSPPEDPASSQLSAAALTASQCGYFAANGKTRICHATGSATNPFTVINVAQSACVSEHAGHPLDYVAAGDPTCGGRGCLPAGAPCDATVGCCNGFTCRSGSCQAADRCVGVTCTLSDQCHTSACNPSTGACVNAPRVDGFACNDGNACTQTDTCQSGVCAGTSPVLCTASDVCHTSACNPSTGACVNAPKLDGFACNDGNACTQTDTCQSGVCAGTIPVLCTAPDVCHVSACEPSTGACVNAPRLDGFACNDGNACTQTDTCQSGVCAGSNPVLCTAPDVCHASACDPFTGACRATAFPVGAPCTNNDACFQKICICGATRTHCPSISLCGLSSSCNSGLFESNAKLDLATYVVITALDFPADVNVHLQTGHAPIVSCPDAVANSSGGFTAVCRSLAAPMRAQEDLTVSAQIVSGPSSSLAALTMVRALRSHLAVEPVFGSSIHLYTPLHVSGRLSPGTTTTVEIFVDGISYGPAGVSNGNFDGEFTLGRSSYFTLGSSYHPVNAWLRSGQHIVSTMACTDSTCSQHRVELTTAIDIVGASLTATPTHAAPGETVSVTGDGFAPGLVVEVFLGPASLGMATPDAQGGFTLSATLPATMSFDRFVADGERSALPPGDTALQARYNREFQQSTPFHVDGVAMGPALAITPSSGSGHGSVHVVGTGFGPGARVRLYQDDVSNTTLYLADAAGTFVADIVLLPYAASSASRSLFAQQAEVGLTPGRAAWARYDDLAPSLTAPSTLEPGASFSMVGNGFTPTALVKPSLDSLMAAVPTTVTASGSFSTPWTLGPQIAPGSHVLSSGPEELIGLTADLATKIVEVAAPVVTVTPSIVAPGAVVTLHATALPPGKAVVLLFDPLSLPISLGTTSAGVLDATITVPFFALKGIYHTVSIVIEGDLWAAASVGVN